MSTTHFVLGTQVFLIAAGALGLASWSSAEQNQQIAEVISKAVFRAKLWQEAR